MTRDRTRPPADVGNEMCCSLSALPTATLGMSMRVHGSRLPHRPLELNPCNGAGFFVHPHTKERFV
jgi:hypothetical protein